MANPFGSFATGLRDQLTNPLFLGGAAMLGGDGWQGAMRGMQVGAGLQEQTAATEEKQRKRALFPSLVAQADPSMRGVLQMSGPDQGADILTRVMMQDRQDRAAMDRQRQSERLDREKWGTQRQLMEAQIDETRAQAEERRRTVVNGPYKDLKQRADVEEGLRKEIAATSKDYTVIRDAHAKIKSFEKDNSAAGDVALVYSFMKMLDPGSVVREAEYATAENARGVDPTLRAVYNKILTGERLTPAQRTDFIRQADGIANTQSHQYRRTLKGYEGVAGRLQVDPRNVVLDDRSKVGNAPQLLDQARDAIARGANRDAVLQRLREQGVDAPEGL